MITQPLPRCEAAAAWFAVVTVDPDLGLVRVERMAGACGAAVWPR
jgi:CO/xanthine dehydrogenase Mo-binding subunit